MLSSRLKKNSRRRRAAQMLEFALLLPAFIFFICFTVDMGRMMYSYGVLQDAAYQTARNGAQLGLTNDPRITQSFVRAIDEAPAMTATRAQITSLTPEVCRNNNDPYVRVRATYDANFITPGFRTLLGLFGNRPEGREGDWVLNASAVARCEVTRG